MVQQGVVDILTEIVRAQLAIFAVAFCAIAGVAVVSLQQQYHLTEQYDRDLVRWHLHDRARKIQSITADFAFLDATYDIVMRGDTLTLQRDVTTYLSKVHNLDMVGVFDSDGRRIASSEQDEHNDFDFFKLFRPEIERIVASRNDRVPGQKNLGGTVLWVMLDDMPHLAAISPIYTTDQFVSRTLPERMAWLMMVEAPHAALLAEMAERYRLQDIALTYPGVANFNNEFPIVLRDGTSNVAIAWNSRLIGIGFARHLIPLVLLSLLVLFAFGWHVIRRTRSVGLSLDRLHAQTRAEQARLRSLFDNSSDPLVVHDEAGIVLDCNMRLCERGGFKPGDLIGKSILQWLPNYPIEALSHFETIGILQIEAKNKDETSIPVEVRLNRYGDENERRFVVSARDISQRLKAEKKIWHKAHFDPLTDLPNRALFSTKLNAVLMRATEEATGCALMFVDLDGFKNVNDTLGHDAGDALLVQVADRFRASIHGESFVARLGGDEFGLIVPQARDGKLVERFAEELSVRLAQPYELHQGTVNISASIGIAFSPKDGFSATSLLNAADRAMYQAKRNARGHYRLASSVRNHGHGHRRTVRR